MSGRIPQNEALKKSTPWSKRDIAAIAMSGPGSNSKRVGHSFLKRVVGFAMNPWGIRSRRKCESNDATDTITTLCSSFAVAWMVSAVMKHDVATWVVAVMTFDGYGNAIRIKWQVCGTGFSCAQRK